MVKNGLYQLKLKKYIDRTTKLDDGIQQIFNIVFGKCSPGMEQALSAVKGYKVLKEKADSIKLLQPIEKICYDYQPHDYPPWGMWEALDKLGKAIPPETIMEAEHYGALKTVVELYKTSGVNFALLCTRTVDTAMEELYADGEISKVVKYKEVVYFILSNAERKLVNARAEEICISTRLLSLSSNNKFAASKQELRNNLVKGEKTTPGPWQVY